MLPGAQSQASSSHTAHSPPPGPVWDAENFLMGAPAGDLQGPLNPLVQLEALSAPQEAVEVGGPRPLGMRSGARVCPRGCVSGAQALSTSLPTVCALETVWRGEAVP